MVTHRSNCPALLGALLLAILLPTAQAGPKDVPFRATLNVEETIANDAACLSGFRGSLVGRGTVTHLGAVKVSSSHCVAFGGRGSVTIIPDVFTFTAANGDLLTAQFMGTISPFPGDLQTNTFVGNYLITGGSGRFADADGEGLLSGSLTGSLSTTRVFTGAITAEGRISY